MENFRSMSCREGRPELESSNGGNADHSNWGHPSNMQDLRSYSTSYASCSSYAQNPNQPKAMQNHNQNQTDIKTGRRSNSSKAGGWSLSDPEMQRKKRVASYKVYSVEGKMKGSLRKSFRWIKNTCSQVVHGWR